MEEELARLYHTIKKGEAKSMVRLEMFDQNLKATIIFFYFTQYEWNSSEWHSHLTLHFFKAEFGYEF